MRMQPSAPRLAAALESVILVRLRCAFRWWDEPRYGRKIREAKFSAREWRPCFQEWGCQGTRQSPRATHHPPRTTHHPI